jgi:hypothetical protein
MLSISENPATSLDHSISTTVPEFPITPFRRDTNGIPKPPGLRTRASSSTLCFTPKTCYTTPYTSPRRITKKTPHPVFLTKGSSIRSFDHITGPEWDQDSREKSMDILMKQFMEQVSQQGQASSGLKETVDIYKSRGRPLSPKRILEQNS